MKLILIFVVDFLLGSPERVLWRTRENGDLIPPHVDADTRPERLSSDVVSVIDIHEMIFVQNRADHGVRNGESDAKDDRVTVELDDDDDDDNDKNDAELRTKSGVKFRWTRDSEEWRSHRYFHILILFC